MVQLLDDGSNSVASDITKQSVNQNIKHLHTRTLTVQIDREYPRPAPSAVAVVGKTTCRRRTAGDEERRGCHRIWVGDGGLHRHCGVIVGDVVDSSSRSQSDGRGGNDAAAGLRGAGISPLATTTTATGFAIGRLEQLALLGGGW